MTECPYKHWFVLVTVKREFKLFAPTREERDLWVEGLHRMLFVPVDMPCWEMKASLIPEFLKHTIKITSLRNDNHFE